MSSSPPMAKFEKFGRMIHASFLIDELHGIFQYRPIDLHEVSKLIRQIDAVLTPWIAAQPKEELYHEPDYDSDRVQEEFNEHNIDRLERFEKNLVMAIEDVRSLRAEAQKSQNEDP